MCGCNVGVRVWVGGVGVLGWVLGWVRVHAGVGVSVGTMGVIAQSMWSQLSCFSHSK